MDKKSPWRSRKWWVALITTIVMMVTWWTGVEINLEQLLAVVLPVIAYIFGESWVDASASKNTTKTTTKKKE